MRTTFLAILVATAALAAQQPMPGGRGPIPAPGQPGPWDQDILVYAIDANGGSRQIATFERAGVSALARMPDGRLIAAHQYFPENAPADFDKVAIHFSTDEGRTWTAPAVMQLTGLPAGNRFPFDPTLVVLPDGRIRMYFTSLRGRQFNEDVPAIHSAISSNGVDYAFEPGKRFVVDGRPVIDCAVVLHQGIFHLFAPDNGVMPATAPGQPPQIGATAPEGVGYHATSKDGLTFTREADVRVEGRRRWLGGAQTDGKTITFFGTGAPGVWMATSADAREWRLGDGLRVMGADPGAVAARGGGWVVSVTGPPRPGTPSSRRGRGGD